MLWIEVIADEFVKKMKEAIDFYNFKIKYKSLNNWKNYFVAKKRKSKMMKRAYKFL